MPLEDILGKSIQAFIYGEIKKLERCSYTSEEELVEALKNTLVGILGESALMCKEVTLPDGRSADLLILVPNESPIIVEAKLSPDRKDRRTALAQLLEYMTGLYLDPEAILSACSEEGAPRDLLESALERASRREITGIIAADNIPDQLKQTIEVLNSELRNMSVYGLELQKYCGEDEVQVIVPRLIGDTPEATVKHRQREEKIWRYEDLAKYIVESDIDETLKRRLLDLLEWAKEKGVLAESKAKEATFGLKVKPTGKRVLTVYNNGRLDVYYGTNYRDYFKTDEDRRRLRDELVRLGLFDEDTPEADTLETYKRTKSIAQLTEEQYEEFKRILEDLLL